VKLTNQLHLVPSPKQAVLHPHAIVHIRGDVLNLRVPLCVEENSTGAQFCDYIKFR
jgi:hypothetical protein